jgi:small conductance mechanosensitive channel
MMKSARRICFVVLGFGVLLAPGLTFAQRDAGAEAADANQAEPAAPGADAGVEEAPAEAASEAKRVVRIRQVIELDKQRLRWLRAELGARTRWFEDLAAGMTQVAEERNQKREKLEALEAAPEPDRDALAALQAEVDELQEDYSLYDTQTDLALKAEKTVREQIEAMEAKIAQDENVLGKLTGEITVELATPPVGAPAEPVKEAGAPQQPVGMPSLSPQVAPAAPSTPTVKKTSSAMTSAQLQAAKVLERKTQEVELAKLALADFVERKRALQRQIEYEQRLAKNDAEEIENLEHVLDIAEGRLEKYRKDGAPAEKIEQRKRGNRTIVRVIAESKKNAEARNAYIESLLQRLANLEESELGITKEVDATQEEADAARRHANWLESPIHPRNVQHWAKERGPRILLVLFAAISLLVFVQLSARRIARALVRRRRGARAMGTGRADTLAVSFRSVSRIVIVVFAVLLVLQEAGIDIKTVLGGAAILGVAVAFGAQDLMKDYFSGFLILAEDQYQLGDLVTIGGVTGTVESVNMRVTVLRDLEGRVHFIPNGNIDHVTNRTYAWGRPVFEIPIGFDEDADAVMAALIQIAAELAEDQSWQGRIIGPPDMLGVDKFTDYGQVIKFMVKTQPDQLFAVRREMLRRISKRFRELGIRITVPQRILARDGAEPGTQPGA